jgi:hypothetical protein
LSEAGGRLFVAGAEGTPFEVACGRYSEQAHLDNFLKAHEGDRLRVDRIGRKTDFVDNPALSIALTVQPCVLQGQSIHSTIRGKGFLARWLYSIPISTVGTRQIAPPPVPPEVAAAYHIHMLALWNAPGAVDGQGNKTTGWFRFSEEADALMRGLEAWIEPQLARDGALGGIADWGSKLAGATALLTGILHVAAGIVAGPAIPAIISASTAGAAIRLAKQYLVPHALAAFDLMTADRRIDDARRVVTWLARGGNFADFARGLWLIRQRTIHRHFLGSRYSTEEVAAIMRLLVEHGYLRVLAPEPRKGPGRPPGPEFEIHPSLFAKQNAENGSRNLHNPAPEAGPANFADFASGFEPPQIADETLGDAPGDFQDAETGVRNLRNSDAGTDDEDDQPPDDAEVF